MSDERILVVEDEPMVAEVVERYLRRDGYDVRIVHDGTAGLAEFDSFRPDLVVLDLMLPGIDGRELCRRIRARSQTPVIMLTARGEEIDKLIGLELGADDYVTKPFGVAELLARIHAVLRRQSAAEARTDAKPLRFADIDVNLATRQVHRAGELVAMTNLEFELLVFLIENPDRVFTREQLLNRVWGVQHTGSPRTVDNFVGQLRAKLEKMPNKPNHLVTVRSKGYRFNL